jgi:hypothetical protein
MAQYFNKIRTTMFLMVGIAWSVHLVNLASDRGYEPFKYIATRGRVERFYTEYAPDKNSEIPSILSKNSEKGERLFKKLENKYGSPVHQLELGPLLQATAYTGWEKLSEVLPANILTEIDHRWEQFHALPLPHQLLMITVQAVIILYSLRFLGIASSDSFGSFLIVWFLIFLCIFRPLPSIQECKISNLKNVFDEVWSSFQTSREQLWALTIVCSLFMFVLSPTDRKLIFFCYLILSLYLTNPANETTQSTLVTDAVTSVVAKGQSASQIVKSMPKGSVSVNDFGLLSVLTFSKASNHHWYSPVMSVGVGGQWLGLVEIQPTQGGMAIKGSPFPAWSVPCLAFVVIWGLVGIF